MGLVPLRLAFLLRRRCGTTNPKEKEATSLPARAAREAELPKAKVRRARPKAAKPPLRWRQLLLCSSPLVPRAPRKPSSSSESSAGQRADRWSLSAGFAQAIGDLAVGAFSLLGRPLTAFNWDSFETIEQKDPRRTAEVDSVSLSHLTLPSMTLSECEKFPSCLLKSTLLLSSTSELPATAPLGHSMSVPAGSGALNSNPYYRGLYNYQYYVGGSLLWL